MRPLRAPIASLMVFMIFLAMCLAALHSGSLARLQAVYVFTLLILFFDAIAARYRGPFWYSSAIVGWGYFLLGTGPLFGHIAEGSKSIAWWQPNINLPSSNWLYDLCNWAIRNSLAFDIAQRNIDNFELTNRVAHSFGVCHSIATTGLAVGGGIVAMALATRRFGPE